MKTLIKEIDKLQAEIKALRPLGKQELKELREYYKIGLTYTSNALEGNSLTETETKVVLEDGITIGGKPLKDHYEAAGHADAFDYLYKLQKASDFSEADIKKLHALFYKRLNAKLAGKYRKVQVFISGSRYPLPKPTEIKSEMENFIKNFGENPGLHTVEWAAKVHKEFVFIHPFIDGNGRVARLLMNLILFKSGYSVTIIPPVLRVEYIASLEKAHTHEEVFIKFIAGCVKQSLTEYLRLVK